MYNFIMSIDLEPIARYFWDTDMATLKWEDYKNFIIRRILQYGDFNSIKWLRTQVGDDELRNWIVTRNGRGLSPRQIRYWALILDIDASLADEWVKVASNTIWERRR
jgi:hypothetical protein